MTDITDSQELAPETVAVPETTDVPTEAPAATEETEKPKQEDRTFTREELERTIQKEKAKLERRFERKFNERLEAENAQLRAQIQQPKAPEVSGKPERQNFADDVSFIEALADFKATERIKEVESKREAESRATQQQREFREVTSTYEKRAEAMRAIAPDYDEVVGNDELNISKAMAEAIALSENGPKLAYHLGKNPSEADRIARLHPSLAGVELGKLEAKLSAPAAKTISNAPAPLSPVSSAKSIVAELSKLSQEDYEKARAKQGARWAR